MSFHDMMINNTNDSKKYIRNNVNTDNEVNTNNKVNDNTNNEINLVLIEDDYMNDYIQERERAIEEIEQSVMEVNEIFQDLNTIIREQNDDLVVIDNNIEETNVNIEKGNEELKLAQKYFKSSIALTSGVVGLVVGGPIGLACGIKSSAALVGMSLGTGYVGYNMSNMINRFY